MAEPLIVAESGRFVVAQDGAKVLVFDRGSMPAEGTILLLTICSLLFGMFGLVSLFSSAGGGVGPTSTVVGAAFLAVGVLSFVATTRATKAHHRAHATPLSARRPVAVFDRQYRVYVDGDGELVAPLDEVRFERRMQATSSSSKLVAVTPFGTRVLVRGNLFGGGVGNLDEVLTAALRDETP